MKAELSFFEPWMAAAGICIIVVVVVHKRAMFESSQATPLRQFLVPAILHLVPAAIGWFFVVMTAVRHFQERGSSVPGFAVQAAFFIGFLALIRLLLAKEFEALRRLPPKW